MKISKLPLRIEPGLVALLCAWFYFDPAGTFLPFVCAAALHEAGHLAMLLWLRQPVHSLCLGLQGAVLRTGPLRYRDELLAAAAGPAMNLALLLAFSRTLPRFALVNFCLLAYNLLPFYPLDGGRLLRAVLRTLLPLRAAVWAERGVCLLCGALLLACAGYLTLCWHAGPWPLLVCLLLGLLLSRLGILGKNELSASKSEGFVFFLLMAVVLAGFSTTTPQMFTQMLPPLLLILLTDLVAITLLSALVGRMLGFSAYMGIALGMNIMIGFPLNMLISQDVIYRLVVDERKRAILMSEIGDRMVICGMISVTFLSTTAASFLVALMK